ncbi:MAG: 16S rRNA (guanine(966)-N(2))-methyltransferase RsmD [Firmicutes bacterium]|nr:16S rRNA (guanine(966)-N(2))-methyltransferase RsmD [Bacillota bacterium]MCL5038317.1 16S rRNA (guanine(966)-N(2))-methyltransferase RsmD [Bacillota bacterium]
MRVIAGKVGGLRLKTLRGLDLRPTMDRVKESIFNVLAPDLAESRALDLFAGSGSLGIEALSRGARQVIFVEKRPEAVVIIKENLSFTGLLSAAQVIRGEALQVIRTLGSEEFDHIFADPPYNRGLALTALTGIARQDLLKLGGTLVLETSKREELPEEIGDLSRYRHLDFGGTRVHFYKRTLMGGKKDDDRRLSRQL